MRTSRRGFLDICTRGLLIGTATSTVPSAEANPALMQAFRSTALWAATNIVAPVAVSQITKWIESRNVVRSPPATDVHSSFNPPFMFNDRSEVVETRFASWFCIDLYPCFAGSRSLGPINHINLVEMLAFQATGNPYLYRSYAGQHLLHTLPVPVSTRREPRQADHHNYYDVYRRAGMDPSQFRLNYVRHFRAYPSGGNMIGYGWYNWETRENGFFIHPA
jgi:hypothetical protein